MSIPKDALKDLPAAQRAKIEESMRAREGKVSTRTAQSGVTTEDLERGDFVKSGDQSCTRKDIEQSAKRFEAEATGSASEPSQTHSTVVAPFRESYTVTMDRKNAAGQLLVEMSRRWVAAGCVEGDED